jgi:phage replication initiation protein
LSCVFKFSKVESEEGSTHLQYETLLDKAKNLFGPASEWQQSDRGRHGYKSGVTNGAISIWYDGALDMGVNVQVPGTGCRQLEADGLITPEGEFTFTWLDFLKLISLSGGSFTRLDVAVDDRVGVLNLDRIKQYRQNACVVSRLEDGQEVNGFKVSTGKDTGSTVYFGSKKSNVLVRFYDKAAERLAKGHPLPQGEIWNRCELQARKEQAEQLAGILIAGGVPAFAKVLNNFISFREVGAGGIAHRYRWRVADWWSEFIATTEKMSLWVEGIQRSLTEKADTVEKQMAPLISTIYDAPDLGERWLKKLITEGRIKRKAKYNQLLEAHNSRIARALAVVVPVSDVLPEPSQEELERRWYNSPHNPADRREVKGVWVPRSDLSWSPN